MSSAEQDPGGAWSSERVFADLGRILVVVPTYNEADNIAIVLSRLLLALPEAEVLVVDDGSPDGTGELAATLAGADPRVDVLQRATKDGLGAAYLAGFAWGVHRGVDVLVEMDADCSHQPEQLPRLLHALRHADVVLGSRYVAGGSVLNWPLHRRLLSRGGNTFVRLALGLRVRDSTSGFRAIRVPALQALTRAEVSSAGYCFQVDIARRSVRAGLRVVEVPITFVERERGRSKMDAPIVGEALWRVACWGMAYRMGQAKASAAAVARLAARPGTGAPRSPEQGTRRERRDS